MPDEINRGIAETVYELRYARVSKWLRAGFFPAQVALWAGHTVKVLHEVYVRVIDGTTAESKKRLAKKPDGTPTAPETS